MAKVAGPLSADCFAIACRAVDNRMIERLSRFLKYECIYLNAFETGSEAQIGIGNWMTYYTAERPHSSHGILTPEQAFEYK
jgi:putative transposase